MINADMVRLYEQNQLEKELDAINEQIEYRIMKRNEIDKKLKEINWLLAQREKLNREIADLTVKYRELNQIWEDEYGTNIKQVQYR
jgi:peptidoglycan hydrolase CwlO-like protein